MLKVGFELSFAEPAGRKIFPGPVMFVIHDLEERFKKRRFLHVNGHDALPSRVEPRYNSDDRPTTDESTNDSKS
jgi:hypothetical protein